MVGWYEKVLSTAAKHRLPVDFHGAYVPTGLARTWPNYITQEGVLGNEMTKFHAAGVRDACDIAHQIPLPFTRGLLGPADYTPGGFRNVPAKSWKPSNPASVPGTRARQLALAAILDSPPPCLRDGYASYRDGAGFKPGMAFFRDLPTVWDDTRVLSSELARHIVEARRKGDEWVVAAIDGETPLTLEVRLDFLGDGEYEARIFADKPESETDATLVTHEVRIVRKRDTLKIPMASGGGFAARLRPRR